MWDISSLMSLATASRGVEPDRTSGLSSSPVRGVQRDLVLPAFFFLSVETLQGGI